MVRHASKHQHQVTGMSVTPDRTGFGPGLVGAAAALVSSLVVVAPSRSCRPKRAREHALDVMICRHGAWGWCLYTHGHFTAPLIQPPPFPDTAFGGHSLR